jgi:recombination protein RecR
MNIDKYPSKLLENAVNEFSKLPGIGRKSALRLVLHLLRQDVESVNYFGNSLIQLRSEIKHCKICHNISDFDVCQICNNHARNRSVICVVENIRDVMSIENTQQFNGLYHVLGGIISPMDGIGPSELEIESLVKRVNNGEIIEVILALSTTMEGDTTNFYIYRKLKDKEVRLTTLARGVSVGDELEYTDEITLGRSLANRVPYESSMGK